MKTNEAVIRKAYDAFSAGDVAAFTALLADDLVVHVPPGLPISGDYRGRDAFLNDMFGKVVAALGGPPRLELHDIVASEDHVVGLYTVHVERDGKSYQWSHVNVYHVRGDRITEFWWIPFDHETVRQALG